MVMKRLAVGVIFFFSLAFPFLTWSGENQSAGPSDPVIREFTRFVNAERRSIGCPELIWDGKIAIVALKHSTDMVSRNFFDHINPDRKTPFERLKESKLDFSGAAENIALGPKTGREAFEVWMRSPGHRKNMLDNRFTRHGVGRLGVKWTHLLIKP
jgi:uncharacterized protein YkwD